MTVLNNRLLQIYYIFFVFLLGFFVFAFPPFQKPDEPLHFERAFALAMGQIACKFDSKQSRGYFTFPTSVSEFPKAMMSNSIIMNPDGKFPIALFRGYNPISPRITTDLLYNCTLPFTGYIPLAIGIILVFPFNNLLVSFYAARLCAAIIFLIAIYFSVRIVSPRYRLLIILSSLLPMVLQQVTAVSYDSVAISTGFLLFSLFTRYLVSKKVSAGEALLFYVLLIIFLFTKPGYYFFALLLFFPLRLLNISVRKKIILSGILFAGIIGVIWYSLLLPI